MPINQQIIEGIATRIDAVLPDYTRADFEIFTDKNRNTQRSKRYAIQPLGLNSAEGALGTVGRLDLIQRFRVIFFDSYTGNLSNDNEVGEKAATLINDAVTAFNSIAPNKIGLGGVKNINTLTIADPDYDEQSKEIFLPITFNIYYFRSI